MGNATPGWLEQKVSITVERQVAYLGLHRYAARRSLRSAGTLTYVEAA